MSKFIKSLKFIFMPTWWIRINPTSQELSDFINDAIDRNLVKIADSHHVDVNGKRIWMANYPYGYGEYNNAMPDRLTVERLNKHVWSLEFLNGK